MIDPEDEALIRAFLAGTRDMSPERAASLVPGISGPTVRRYRDGKLPSRLTTETRLAMKRFLSREEEIDEETPEQAVAGNMPDVHFLYPRARAIYDRAVGSYLTRRWPQPIIERAAWDLVNYIIGANTLRTAGPGRPELTEDEQVMVLENSVGHVERAYGPNGVVRRF